MARQVGFEQADMSDPSARAECGLKLKGRKLVSDDDEELEIGELNDEEFARHTAFEKAKDA